MENIIIAIISAGLAAFINLVFQIIEKILDGKKEKQKDYDDKLQLYREKKEEVYIAAIDRLLQIRRGFDFTQEQVTLNTKLKKELENNNEKYMEISARLRLYATDDIFRQFQELVKFAKFSYAPQSGPRLFGDCKILYNTQITLLARFMQEDLGYREMATGQDLISCPKCKSEHDIIAKCPKCGMTFKELQTTLRKQLEQEYNNTSTDYNSP